MNYGDVRLGDTVDLKFTTRRFTTGAPFALAGSPAVVAYVGNGTAEITAGITLTLDFDGRTGLNHVRVVASSGNGYAAGTSVALVISAGTVDGVSVVGEVVGMFSIEARSALMSTVAAQNKLDVTATGEAGIDWNNIGSPTTTVNLSGTTVKNSTDVKADTAAIKAKTDNLPTDPADQSLIIGATDAIKAETALIKTDTTAIKAKTDTIGTGGTDVNVVSWRGTAVPVPDTPGYPVMTVKRGTGPGEILLNSGSIEEVLAVLGDIGGNLNGNVEGSLFNLSPSTLAAIKTQIVDALANDLYGESTGVPPASASLAAKIRWLTTVARNKILQTATQQRIRNDADTADIATVTVGDDGTTFTRGEWL